MWRANTGWVRSHSVCPFVWMITCLVEHVLHVCVCVCVCVCERTGLENMYQLTRNRKYMLRVDLEDFTGRKGFALYSSFSVDCECVGYQLHVSGFTDGGAGRTLSFILMNIHL